MKLHLAKTRLFQLIQYGETEEGKMYMAERDKEELLFIFKRINKNGNIGNKYKDIVQENYLRYMNN